MDGILTLDPELANPVIPEVLAPVSDIVRNTVDKISAISTNVVNTVGGASGISAVAENVANGLKNSLANIPLGLNLEEFSGFVGTLAFVGGFFFCLAIVALCIPGLI